jgi:hypothetical protein
MITYLIVRTSRRAADHLSALCNRHRSLIESILSGLGMFGLAANGMCLAALPHSLPEISKSGSAAER